MFLLVIYIKIGPISVLRDQSTFRGPLLVLICIIHWRRLLHVLILSDILASFSSGTIAPRQFQIDRRNADFSRAIAPSHMRGSGQVAVRTAQEHDGQGMED